MRAPVPEKKTSATTAETPAAPFEVRVRSRTELGSRAERIKHDDPARALRRMLDMDVAGFDEPIVHWSPKHVGEAVCVDIDAPDALSALPEHAVVGRFFPESLPRPLFAFRSHGGGLNAVFVAVDGVPALDLAAAWYLLAPLGAIRAWRAEVKTDLRHPRGVRPSGGETQRCGPLASFMPSSHVALLRDVRRRYG